MPAAQRRMPLVRRSVVQSFCVLPYSLLTPPPPRLPLFCSSLPPSLPPSLSPFLPPLRPPFLIPPSHPSLPPPTPACPRPASLPSRGNRYNEKADVHSFAVVTWELCTGWLPYSGLSPDQFMFQAVQVGHFPRSKQGHPPLSLHVLAGIGYVSFVLPSDVPPLHDAFWLIFFVLFFILVSYRRLTYRTLTARSAANDAIWVGFFVQDPVILVLGRRPPRATELLSHTREL